MDGKNEMEYWVTRHAKSGQGVESSPGLSEQGVEMAKERAKTIAELIENSQKGSIILYGGVTSEPRTRSTMELYADEAEKILKEHGGTARFIKKEDIKELADQSGYSKTANEITSQIDSMPQEKVVIELPLFLKEFSMEKYFYEEDGETVKPEWQKLLDKHGKNYTAAIEDWFSDPELSKTINPEEMVRGCMKAMQRLENFIRRFFPDRPVKIGFVGHSFLIDALLTYIANDGQISSDGFKKLGEGVVKETELATIEFDGSGGLHLRYRDKDFHLL
jgi:hypothetical protein